MPEGRGLLGVVDTGLGYGLLGGLETTFTFIGSSGAQVIFHQRHVNAGVGNPDRYVDRIFLTEIDGLHGGPELRISEEMNQSDNGGYPMDSWLGGRTVTFTGRIEAYTLNKLRDMQSDMRQALYGDLTEQQLLWTPGHANRYLSPATFVQFKLKCRLADKIAMRDVQTNGNTFWRDFQFSLRATDPVIINTTQRTHDKNSYADINFGWVGTNFSPSVTGVMEVDPFVKGAPSTMTNTTIPAGTYTFANGRLVPPSGLSTYFFRLTGPTNNQSLSGGMSLQRPATIAKVLTPSPITTNDYCAVAIKNSVGNANDYLWVQLEHTSATQARLKINKTVSGTPTILATGTAFTVAADTTYWIKTTHSKTNVITAALYSTDPGPTGTGTQVGTTLSYTLVSADTTAGTGSTYFSASGFPSQGVGYIASTAFDSYELDQLRVRDEGDGTNDASLTTVNYGNWPSKVSIVITGPITNATINAFQSLSVFGEQRQFIVNGSIPAGSFYTYDPVSGLFYKDGVTTNDVYSQINSQSRELYIPPGISTWYMTGTGTTGATALQFKSFDSYI